MTWMIVDVFLCVWLGSSPAERVEVDFASIRGANYVPSYAVNDVVQWLEYNSAVIDKELAYAQKLGLNSVRVFLQSKVYEHDPESFLQNLEDFVALCHKHEIRPMIVLFDSCFGISPSLESREQWVANPGPDQISEKSWPRLERYVRDVVGCFRVDPRILIWDVMNEPNVTWQSRTEQGKDKIWQFVRHFCGFLKSLDPVQPITVGIAGRTDDSLVADLVDVLSLHSYRETGAELRRNLEETRKQAQTVGKPYLISECIAPGWGSPFEMVMPVIREQEIGYYFWELMIGKDQFRNITGVFYPDGSVRNKNHVRAVMADRYRQDMFEEKPRWDGVPINPFGKRYREVRGLELALKTFERMATSATTRQNFSERYTFLKSVVTLTWGGQDVFKPFHHQIRTALADVEQSASEGETSSPEDNKAIDDLLQRLKPELPGQTRAKIADWFMRW